MHLLSGGFCLYWQNVLSRTVQLYLEILRETVIIRTNEEAWLRSPHIHPAGSERCSGLVNCPNGIISTDSGGSVNDAIGVRPDLPFSDFNIKRSKNIVRNKC